MIRFNVWEAIKSAKYRCEFGTGFLKCVPRLKRKHFFRGRRVLLGNSKAFHNAFNLNRAIRQGK
jgi:hypothetical protein